MANAANQQLWVNDAFFDEVMPIDPGITYFEDSMVYWNSIYIGTDGLVGKILPLTSDSNGANFVGILRDLNPVQVYAPTQTPNQPSPLARVTKKAQFSMYVTAGDNYVGGQTVYCGADSQTISQTGSNAVGYVAFEQTPITSAVAGTQILVNMRNKYPTGA